MSISNFASAVTAVKVAAPAKAARTPRPWDVYKVFACEQGATLDPDGRVVADKAVVTAAQEHAIEGFFGPVDSEAALQGLLLGLGVLVAHAPKNADGYIDGLKGFRRPWKSMFSMALSGLLPQDGDLALLLTWADVLWASAPALRDIVTKVQADCISRAGAIAEYQADLATVRATYKAEHVRKGTR